MAALRLLSRSPTSSYMAYTSTSTMAVPSRVISAPIALPAAEAISEPTASDPATPRME